MNDPYYTPEEIAAYMVAHATLDTPRTVADFAAGDGILLSHALERWNEVTVYATDIDQSTVHRLRRHHSDWSVSKCDFLSQRSRSRSPVLRSTGKGVDLVLLNPPYSCRGARTFEAEIGDTRLKCSKALAFVLLSARYLSDRGQIVAILPQSSFASEKDANAWELLNSRFTIRKGVTAARGSFDGCYSRCTVVRMSPRKRECVRRKPVEKPRAKITVRLIRGSLPLHLKPKGDRTMVHSTDLIDSMVVLNGHVGSSCRPSVTGPCVLFPRVGQPRIDKVALYKRRKRVVLSDCVIGLQCGSISDATWLHLKILKNRGLYKSLYTGTCAKYTTVQRIIQFLADLGCAVET